MNRFDVWKNERPESFLKHATVATSQYDAQYRSMAAEILALREAKAALDECIKLQAHYAQLLNMHDGGGRHSFKDSDEFIARMRELSK